MATNAFENPTVINQSVDEIMANTPIGSISRAIGNSLYGINLRGTPPPLPMSKNHYGYVFFTRPQLNFSIYNISNFTPFYSLLTNNRISIPRYVRLMLDPRLAQLGFNKENAGLDIKTGSEPGLTCPFVNPTSAFIPIMTNTITTMSGWPDLTIPIYTSAAGAYNEEFTAVDGATNNFEAFDIDATFQNVKGDILIYMMYFWMKYSSLVFEGILNPYLDFILENEIDYNTRIYRLVLDNTKRYVTYIACTGASFPVNVPSGNLFDFNRDSPLNTKNQDLSFRFRSNGFLAFEDIIKYEFNEVTTIFNPSFKKLLQDDLDYNGFQTERDDPEFVYVNNGLVKIPPNLGAVLQNSGNPRLSSLYNRITYRATPWINLYTNELEWWVPEQYFNNFDFDSADTVKYI